MIKRTNVIDPNSSQPVIKRAFFVTEMRIYSFFSFHLNYRKRSMKEWSNLLYKLKNSYLYFVIQCNLILFYQNNTLSLKQSYFEGLCEMKNMFSSLELAHVSYKRFCTPLSSKKFHCRERNCILFRLQNTKYNLNLISWLHKLLSS